MEPTNTPPTKTPLTPKLSLLNKPHAIRTLIITISLLLASAGGTVLLLHRLSSPPEDIVATTDQLSTDDTVGSDPDPSACRYLSNGALICDAGSDIPSNYLTCVADGRGAITCSDADGNIIETTCITMVGGTLHCQDRDGDYLDNTLYCMLDGADAITCRRPDGTTIIIPIRRETVLEIEKEVIVEKEVEINKEVIVEKEIIIEKVPPILTSRHQTPDTPTNQDVIVALSFDKQITLPPGWAYAGSEQQITRTFVENITTNLTVADHSGNSTQIPIHISAIDKTPPRCTATIQGGGESWHYTITCDEPIAVADWSKTNDYTYANTFTTPMTGTVITVSDLVGNSSQVTLGV